MCRLRHMSFDVVSVATVRGGGRRSDAYPDPVRVEEEGVRGDHGGQDGAEAQAEGGEHHEAGDLRRQVLKACWLSVVLLIHLINAAYLVMYCSTPLL